MARNETNIATAARFWPGLLGGFQRHRMNLQRAKRVSFHPLRCMGMPNLIDNGMKVSTYNPK
jgi:hypothetical protein